MGSFLLLVAFAWQQPVASVDSEAIEAAAVLKRALPASEMLGFGGSSMMGRLVPNDKSLSKYKLPAGAKDATVFQLVSNKGTTSGIIAKSAGSKTYDLMWVPLSQTQLDASEAIRGKPASQPEFLLFENVPVGVSDGDQKEVHLALHAGDHFHVLPSQMIEATVELEGKSVLIGIIDGNMDGKYGGGSKNMYMMEEDYIVIDFNGDGKLQGSSPETFRGDVETSYLSSRVQMPDGNFYQISTSDDLKKVILKRDAAPLGSIQLTGASALMQIYSEEGILLLRPIDGVIRIPEGRYAGASYYTQIKDKNGKNWSVGVSDLERELVVTPGSSLKRALGGPYKLKVSAERSKPVPPTPVLKNGKWVLPTTKAPVTNPYSIDIELKDASGRSVNYVVDPDGKQPPEPVLTILDAKGKVVKTEKFHYG